MSSFPVTASDDAGMLSAMNYLLSGPSGLGQNFQGFSNYNTGYLSGNSRPPFSTLEYTYTCYGVVSESRIVAGDNNGLVIGMRVSGHGVAPGTTIVSIGDLTTDGSIITLSAVLTDNVLNVLNFRFINHPWLYQEPITCTANMLDEYTYIFTFSAPWVSPGDNHLTPFYVGQPIIAQGFTNTIYNQTFTPIGVTECSTLSVTCRSDVKQTIQPADSSGGNVSFSVTTLAFSAFPSTYNFIHTDCNGVATVNNSTDRVFISAQLTNVITAKTPTEGLNGYLAYSVFVNRYTLTLSNNSNNKGYTVTYDKTLTGKLTYIDFAPGPLPDNYSNSQSIETIFTTVIDTPDIGYYWYSVDIAFNSRIPTDAPPYETLVVNNTLGLRSLTTQVVKQ